MLEKTSSSANVKALSFEELEVLCGEIREKIVHTVSKNGGHLASNLGVVELTVALHRVFDCPQDQIVWDVGHQCYTHKILTGRLENLNTIRQKNGLSGFPRRGESQFDPISAGHSSTSISAAVGLASAKSLLGEAGTVVAVIGDGALSGGLAYEGLNNAGELRRNLVVVLNDNEMSISRGVGSMARYLTAIRTMKLYLKTKSAFGDLLKHIPFLGNTVAKIIKKSTSNLKKIIYTGTIFEQLGFLYYGPIDGHDLRELTNVLSVAKAKDRPVLVHVNTTKGKGYEFAEKNPKNFHGTSGFEVTTGTTKLDSDSFSSVFGRELFELAKADPRICAVTAAMKLGTGLAHFARNFKDRFFDVGLAEGQAVTFAGGLAAGGMLPVFAVYSTFLQRSYDQIIHDAALQGLKIVLAIDRAGVVGEDGETHQGLFDVGFLNTVPGVEIYAPTTFSELSHMLRRALYTGQGVSAVRYPRGGDPQLPKHFRSSGADFDIYGDAASPAVLVTYGRLFAQGCRARAALLGELNICVLKLNKIRPIHPHAVEFLLGKSHVFFFEEGMRAGGVGQQLGDLLLKKHFDGDFVLHAVDEEFVPQGTVNETLSALGLDSAGMENLILRRVSGGEKTPGRPAV